MLALTMRAPFWWMTLYGGRDIENFNWAPRHRGPVLIYASPRFAAGEVQRALDYSPGSYVQKGGIPPLELLRARCGQIVGVVDIVDTVRKSQSPWFRGPVGIVLANPRQLDPYTVPPSTAAQSFFHTLAPAEGIPHG